MTKDEALERLLQIISSDNQETAIPPKAKDNEYIIKIELNDNSILFCGIAVVLLTFKTDEFVPPSIKIYPVGIISMFEFFKNGTAFICCSIKYSGFRPESKDKNSNASALLLTCE